MREVRNPKRGKAKTVLTIFVAFLLVFVWFGHPANVKACSEEPDYGQMLQGLLCGADGYGAVAAVGKFIFPLKWDFGAQEASVEFGSWASAFASVPQGMISLYVRGTGWGLGKLFNWSAGAIWDTYHLGEGMNPEDVNITIDYTGEINGLGGFGFGVLSDNGFEFSGSFSQGSYDDEWSVPLTDIASLKNDTFMMAFGAFVFARGSDSFAAFNDTFQLSFTDDEGNLIMPLESDGGFSQVPIPSTLVLLGGGLAGLLGVRRRMRKKG